MYLQDPKEVFQTMEDQIAKDHRIHQAIEDHSVTEDMVRLAHMGLKNKDHHKDMDHLAYGDPLTDKGRHVDRDRLTYMDPLIGKGLHMDADHLTNRDPLVDTNNLAIMDHLLVSVYHPANASHLHLAGTHHLQVVTDSKPANLLIEKMPILITQ